MKPSDLTVIAHRGASFDAPENTRAAFDLALRQGATALELDVHMTVDGRLVVWHDDDLGRTARVGGSVLSGSITRTTFDEMALCDAGAWFNESFPSRACPDYVGLCPLTLEDVLRTYGSSVPLFIELKLAERNPKMVPEVLASLARYGRGRRKHRVMSTDAATLVRIHCADPKVPLVQVLPHRRTWRLGFAEIARYADAISPLRSGTGPALISAAKAAGLEIYPHTVNRGADIKRLAALGVDGLITDVPARVGAFLEPNHVSGSRPSVPA